MWIQPIEVRNINDRKEKLSVICVRKLTFTNSFANMVRLLLLSLSFALIACSSGIHQLRVDYATSPTPPSPNYSLSAHWAALPTKKDAADNVPKKSNLIDSQASAQVDVFFIYPTIFTKKPTNQHQWNADVNDAVLNQEIQLSTILNQATVFNGSCKIYAPYYRQAHLYAFYTNNKDDATNALNLAYEDVKAAFDYYLKNYNQGRPIIIASHSQGSMHGVRLIKEYFDGKELQKQLVAAYLIGRSIKADVFQHIKPTEKPDEIGVWATWNTVGRNYVPFNYETYYKGSVCINPLLWNSSETYTPKELNKGGVAFKFSFAPQLSDAQIQQNMLWVNRPNIKGSWLVKNKSWHRADYNFFYANIRENVALRVEKFLANQNLPASK